MRFGSDVAATSQSLDVNGPLVIYFQTMDTESFSEPFALRPTAAWLRNDAMLESIVLTQDFYLAITFFYWNSNVLSLLRWAKIRHSQYY